MPATRYYGRRRIAPFMGVVQVIEQEEGRAISVDGRRWQLQLLSLEALAEQVRAYHMPQDAVPRSGTEPDELRTYGVGAQIIADVGVQKMRVLSAPKMLHGIAGFGLEVVEYVSNEK